MMLHFGGVTMTITVAGTIGIDTIITPFGRADAVLGGSASYFALAAANFAPVQLIATVGDDLDASLLDPLVRHGVALAGVSHATGPNFRWGGTYHLDLNTRDTLFTELGVLAEFDPVLPPAARAAEIVFLANLQPDIQARVIDQTPNATLHALDTMNFWISGMRDELTRTLARVDIVIMAEDEVRQFADRANLRAAARAIMDLGPKVIIIKLGSYGALLLDHTGHYFAAPAFPLDDVRDPTGAGDAFAGGFLGYLAQALASQGALTMTDYRRALLHGNILGAFACENFGVERLAVLTKAEITTRYRELIEFTHIGASDATFALA